MRFSEPVSAAARTVRGVLAAALSVGSAALAHSAGGHHDPHPVVLVLTLAISVPVCVALSAVKLSRARLAAAVLFTQGLLHGLFALFPAGGGAGSSGLREVGGHHNGHHEHRLIVAETAAAGGEVAPDATMAGSHLVAAVVSYTLLRRGELILHALTGLLSIRPVLLLCDSGPAVPVRAPQPLPVRPLPAWHVWISAGPRTLRGPPLTAS